MKQLSNLDEVTEYLTRFYRNIRTKYTLDTMRELMAYLENPQDKLKVVHVAGTSGKTSTVYYITALLTASGSKVGTTVSPHVDSLTERVQINGQPLDEATFCEAITEFFELVERAPVQPSWFEAMVAFAYWYFEREGVDYAVIEVGLGGLKDGTNVVSRADKVCVITDIGLDHMAVLGDTLEVIAEQKAGIVKSGNQVFCHRQDIEIMDVFSSVATKQSATLTIIDSKPDPELRETSFSALPHYQQRNWLLAYQTFIFISNRDTLQHLTQRALSEAQQITIPGRMDTYDEAGHTVIMDGAHNVQKMTAFLDSFKAHYPTVKPLFIAAFKEGKEYQELAPLITAIAGRIIATSFEATQDQPAHAITAGVLAKTFQEAGAKDIRAVNDPIAAYNEALHSADQVVVVVGSFYLLSQIRNNNH